MFAWLLVVVYFAKNICKIKVFFVPLTRQWQLWLAVAYVIKL
jgi:hypothetical protein